MRPCHDFELRERIVEHFAATLASTGVELSPFPHVIIRGFFPADVYARLLETFPSKPLYEPFDYDKHQSAGESNRRRFCFTNAWLDKLSVDAKTFWHTIRSAVGCDEFKRLIFRKLSPGLSFRYGVPESETRSLPGYALPELFNETQGYKIKPHPDTRKKVVTMQIALPGDNSQEALGTEFYRRATNPAAWLREPRGFEVAKRMPFLPNTAYAFSVLNAFTLKSWHGRTSLGGQSGERNSLLNIWYEKPENGNADIVAENRAAQTNGRRAA